MLSKMSKPLRIYNIDEINKKILAKPVRVHQEHEFLGPQNLYRDEDYEIYKAKRQEFYEAAKKYKEQNKMALLTNKDKLDVHSNDILRYPECECKTPPMDMQGYEDEPNLTGILLRKRSERPIHEENLAEVEVCSLEPWFKRYLKLCKFIYAARTIILKNRLLKNLEILKKLDKDAVAVYEAQHRKYENVSYPHIFEKFINN